MVINFYAIFQSTEINNGWEITLGNFPVTTEKKLNPNCPPFQRKILV